MAHDGDWLRSSLADAMGWDQVSADGIVEAIEAAGMHQRPFVVPGRTSMCRMRLADRLVARRCVKPPFLHLCASCQFTRLRSCP